ncbi:hypothetical protein CRM22_002071 [Opisthorchis felineus]|uniref:Histone-lysine N-methyltransferase n=1 Tax=Opisthorchis felineus TaxID=147828 RepID=A0A4V3SGI2_OPIFE|nr:hypothetical protein CRM22_002071 [Opisthorchis felineus]
MMNKSSEAKQLLDELTDVVYKSFDVNQVFEFVMGFIAQKYKTELDDVTDIALKQHIIEQRIPSALEECGLMEIVHDKLADVGLRGRLEALESEKEELQKGVQKMKENLDALVADMKNLQLNSFGRVVRLFDDRVIDLAKEDEDLQVIESPIDGAVGCAAGLASKGGWRTLQPSELLIGLSLTVAQPVLCRKGRDTWFPGRIISCLAPATSNDPNSTRAVGPNSAIYRVLLDSAPGAKDEVCHSSLASLALAVSAADLKQKYPVGARVVSIYRDESGGIGYYSGLIAEPPSERNNHRYLLFFDDGYTQYSPPNEIYRICHQSKENWREATEGSQDFIKRYLAQYPQRPMVRLKPGQMIETELDGDWIQATVDKVDASLVLIRFSETHSEWIYRGSTRLEPLFNDLNSTPGQAALGRSQRLEVEYGNVDASLTDKSSACKLRKARKSATGNRDSSLTENSSTVAKAASERRGPSLRRTASGRLEMADLECAGTIVPYLDGLLDQFVRKEYVPHKCTHSCLIALKKSSMSPASEDPYSYKGLNPLEIPFHAGWLRYLLVGHPNDFGRQFIVYNAPCGRQLRSMHEVQRFLDRTDSKLTTDLFSFDPNLCINSEFRAEKTFTHIADISYGKENVPVPCVNSIDNEVPGYIDYIPSRLPIGDVPLMDDDSFVVCCDCTDNCRDRTKCACQQLTAEASSLTNPTGMVDTQAGYRYRRLAQFTVGGIYECNSRCLCDRRCSNRVVQQGLWFRLQVFKTSRKGWGIRALHAIPKGTFLCTYAGAIYDETMAVQEGFDYGDEYQAELDYIETVEKTKEGYESAPEDPEDVDLALQAASQLEDRKSEKDAEYDRQNDSDSSSSHSTNTEMDDDRGSRCSENSSTSSSRNAVGSTEPLTLRRSGLRSSVTRPVAEESNQPTDSEQLSIVDKTSRHVQSSSPSVTTLDSPEIRRAGSDSDSPCPPTGERRLSVDFSEEPMDIAAPVFPSINGSENNVANCSSGDRAIPPEYDSDSGDVSCCTNVSITLEHMELTPDSCLSGSLRSPTTSATDLSATSTEAKAVPKAPSSVSLNPLPNEDPKGFEIPPTRLEGHRMVLARKTVCRGQAVRKSPAANELERKECDLKDGESENKIYTRVKLEEMSNSDSKAFSGRADKKESDTKQTSIGRRSASAKQLRTPPRLYENEVKRHTRARFRARSISLPLQYTALHSVRRIVDRVDFGRIPQIKLARLSPFKSPVHKADECKATEDTKIKQRSERLKSNLSKAKDRKQIKIQLVQEPDVDIPTEPLSEDKETRFKNPPDPRPPLTLRLRRSCSHNLDFYSIASGGRSRASSVDRNGSDRSSVSTDTSNALDTGEKRVLRGRPSHEKLCEEAQPAPGKTSFGPPSVTERPRHRHHPRLQQPRKYFPVAQPDWLPARIYFKDDNPYIMDAKKMGNLGRYFNHSCNPNVFVQNVFIDSHDPRFPEVAFFTKRNIAVGEEMTWDYGYTVDAVPFKVLYCYCGEPNCRIRLL